MTGESSRRQPEPAGPSTIGRRVRALRRSLRLTQSELADGRFSKEYVSQIERGTSRPTGETLEWLAERLGTDRAYLEHGVSSSHLERAEAAIADGEQLVESHRPDDALRAFRAARRLLPEGMPRDLAFRTAKGEAWAHVRSGDVDSALAALEDAAELTVTSGFTDLDRAEVVFMVGVARYSQSRVADAVVLLDEALRLAESSESPSDRVRSDILHWRSRCHRRNRDWVAAQEDSDRALELAEAAADPRRTADALFQASLVAQRQGRWILSRAQAERSRALFHELGDRATEARLLNNLAGLEHLLGRPERALELLGRAFEIFVELDLRVDAGYVCSSRAAIQLEGLEPELAEAQARRALELLEGRADHLEEIGTAQVTLGRALTAQGRLDEAEPWILAAGATFERARSPSYRSDAWLAEGDVRSHRGDLAAAAELYRRAALALMDPDPSAP